MSSPDDSAVTDVERGLTSGEAARRLAAEGPNEIAAPRSHSLIAALGEALREPMFLLLAAICVVYLALGEASQSALLAIAVGVVLAISVGQARRTERALAALRDIASPRALVIRDGAPRRIAGRDVVRGDVLVMTEGDRVPADALVISCEGCTVDESLLTGESVPVRKVASDEHASGIGVHPPGGDDTPFVYAGTLVTTGRAIAVTEATGSRTRMGRLGLELATIPMEPARLQRESARAVRIFAGLGIGVCLLSAVLLALFRTSVLQAILAGLTLAIAMVPEELPMVLTVFLGLGAWRMSRRQVLTRRIPAIDTLGAATVLCVDKTGTLTENRLRVESVDADGPVEELLQAAAAASLAQTADPVDLAFQAAAPNETLAEGRVVREYPFSTSRRLMGRAWRHADAPHLLIAVKGAPESVGEICRLDAATATALDRRVRALASQGMKVLGVAAATWPTAEPPVSLEACAFRFLGLAGLADPVRAGAPEATAACVTAGIRVVMVTGDYPDTARHVARQLGLPNPDRCVTGDALTKMDDAALSRAVQDVNVFARILPEQKLRLVQSLKRNGETVAMTGDGVNDAAALTASHIGIAMGRRGSDVAREAADLVLLDDRFSSLVDAVALGRRIYDNLKRAMSYIVAVHVPIAGLALAPLLLGWPLVLLPVHIVFFELIVDPACSMAFEAEEADPNVMRRKPRKPDDRLFDGDVVTQGWLQGIGLLVPVLVVFGAALHAGRGELEARALAFVTLVLSNLSLIWIARSPTPFAWSIVRMRNAPLWWLTGASLLVLAAVLYAPPARHVFQFSFLHLDDVAISVAAAITVGVWLELVKVWRGVRSQVRT